MKNEEKETKSVIVEDVKLPNGFLSIGDGFRFGLGFTLSLLFGAIIFVLFYQNV